MTDRLRIEAIGTAEGDGSASGPPYPTTGWVNLGPANEGLKYTGMHIGIPCTADWKLDLHVAGGESMAEVQISRGEAKPFWLRRTLKDWRIVGRSGTVSRPDDFALLRQNDLPCPARGDEHLVLDREGVDCVASFVESIIDWGRSTRIT